MRCYYAAFVPSRPDDTAAALAEGCGCPVIRVTMTGGLAGRCTLTPPDP
jgi:hypothetical protein